MKTYMKYMHMSMLAISMLYSTTYADNSMLVAVSHPHPSTIVFAGQKQVEAALVKRGVIPIVARGLGIETGIANYLADHRVSADGLKSEVERAVGKVKYAYLLAQDWNAIRDLLRGRPSIHLAELPKVVQQLLEGFPAVEVEQIVRVLLEEAECHKEEIGAPATAKLVK